MAAGFEPSEFARDFQQFVTGMNRLVPARSSPVRQLLIEHLGRDPTSCLSCPSRWSRRSIPTFSSPSTS
jgi:hypothetical protein